MIEDNLYGIKNLYYSLPDSIKRILGETYNIFPKKLRYGNNYNKFLKEIQQYKLLNIIRIKEVQNKKLMTILDEAFNYIPFYKNLYYAHGIKRNDIKNVTDLCKLPIITKKDIQTNLSDLTSDRFYRYKLDMNSGGSTGTPIHFFLHKGISRVKETVYFDEFFKWFKTEPGEKSFTLRGIKLSNNRIWSYDPIKNTLIASSFDLNPGNMNSIINMIQTFNPKNIQGYPSTLSQLSEFIIENGIKLPEINAVFAGSEPLFPHFKRNIEAAFKTRCINWYGHSERLILGPNCELTSNYHFFPLYGIIEVLDNNQNALINKGSFGKIIATGFDNLVMPLIRYDTEDYGVYDNNHCSLCGRYGTVLSEISGRSIDFIFDRNYKRISITALIYGQHLHAFNNISRMQLYQDKPGELLVIIVKNKGYNKNNEIEIKEKIANTSEKNIDVLFKYVDKIESMKSGKFRFLIQKIKLQS